MHDTILAIFLLLTVTSNAQAQFNTISSNGNYGHEITVIDLQSTNNKEQKAGIGALIADVTSKSDSITPTIPSTQSDLKRNVNKSGSKPSIHTSRHTLYNRSDSKHSRYNRDSIASLPELTLPNLLAEIRRNGIRHPKIVLAQAILETGWFRSSVCRNKHNLFGLTNPPHQNLLRVQPLDRERPRLLHQSTIPLDSKAQGYQSRCRLSPLAPRHRLCRRPRLHSRHYKGAEATVKNIPKSVILNISDVRK